MAVDKWSISAAEIRRKFNGTRLDANPAIAAMPHGAEHLPGKMQRNMQAGLIPAGVLVPLIERSQGLTVLLTERSAELKHHAGQVSFPGGRMEQVDRDIAMTALRETHEEVGIHPDSVEIIGYLPATATVTNYAVTPVIGMVEPDTKLVIDANEVKTAFEVPLSYLMDSANQELAEREFEGRMIPVTSFHFENQRIWGATAGMLVTLREFLFEVI